MNDRPAPTPLRAWHRLQAVLVIAAFVLVRSSVGATDFPAADSASLAAALAAAQPGDRIVMADGTWRDQRIVFRSLGTAERPIVLRAQTPGRVILTGASSLRIGGRHLVVEGLVFRGAPAGPAHDAIAFQVSRDEIAEHCRVTQCAVIDYSPPDKSIGTRYVTLHGRHNRVDRCYFRGKTNQSATMVVHFDPGAAPNHHRIDRNHFAGRPPLGANGGESLVIGWSAAQNVDSRTVVESNLFEECNGEAEIVANKSCGNAYRHNTFLRCEGALSLRVGDRCVVEGNFFLGHGAPRTGGVAIFGEDHRVVNNHFARLTGTREHLGVPQGEGAAVVVMRGSGLVSTGEPRVLQFPSGGPLHPQVKRALIAFNTFADCRAAIDLGVAYPPFDAVSTFRPADCEIANNLVVGTPASRLLLLSGAADGLRSRGNLAGAGPADGAAPVGFTLANVGLAPDAAGVGRLPPHSPAIGAAVGDFPSVATDIDGHARPAVRGDVGCDQFSDAPILHRPLAAADVGPDWRREKP